MTDTYQDDAIDSNKLREYVRENPTPSPGPEPVENHDLDDTPDRRRVMSAFPCGIVQGPSARAGHSA